MTNQVGSAPQGWPARASWALLAPGAALLLAAPVALLIEGLDDHVRVLLLCACAGGVAIWGAVARGRHGAYINVALGSLIALSLIGRDRPWERYLLVGGLVAGALGLLTRRLGLPRTALVAALGLTVAATQVQWEHVHPYVHTWNQYHYVLGTKYFDEVGNHDLYTATLLADQEDEGHFTSVKRVRDMSTYAMLSRKQAFTQAQARGLRARFTDERWAEFKHDLRVFYPMLTPTTWSGVLTDLGFNASPAWVILYRPLLEVVPLSRRALEGLAALQLPMYAVTIAAALWAFGARPTLWLCLWNLLFFGSRGRIYGGFWSYDWLALVVLSTVLIHRSRPALAALPMAVGGLMRGFGGLLAIGPTARWVLEATRRRRSDPWGARFLGALALGLTLLGGFSLTQARGVGAWREWLAKIEEHSSRISTGGRHLGLKVLFGEDWSAPGYTGDLDLRRQIYAHQAWAFHLVAGALVLWTALVVLRRSRLDAALLGLIPAFAVMVLSRYYYAAWSVLLLLGIDERHREGRPVVQLAMLSVLALHEGQLLLADTTPDSRHQAVNLLLLALAVLTLGVYTVIDLRAWRAGRVQGAQPL